MGYIQNIFIFTLFLGFNSAQYQNNWPSLDSRPLPLWYDEAKFGIFVHWGVYSVPAFGSWNAEWFWWNWQGTNPDKSLQEFMQTHYRPGTTYADFAKQFTGVDFNADQLAQIVKNSGAKYFVFTTKHHEGFTMWKSNVSWNWNAVDVGPARNILAEVREAILKVGGVHFGTYFSLFEWFNPFYLMDKASNGATSNYVDSVMYPQLIDLVTTYQPEVIFADGEWEMASSYWKSTDFLQWLYNNSPVKNTVVVNDRWGSETRCKDGGYYTCEDHFQSSKLMPHKYEDCDTVDAGSWGFRRNFEVYDVQTVHDLITHLVIVISTGGNYLLNIGPDHNGRIVPIFEERLTQLGQFVNAHQEAIFATKPWIYQNDSYAPSLNRSSVWYTSQVRDNSTLNSSRIYNPQNFTNTIIYAHVIDWPVDNKVSMSHVLPVSGKTTVKLFSTTGPNIPLSWTQPSQLNGGIQVDITGIGLTKFPSTDALVLKIEYAADQNHNPLSYLDEYEAAGKSVFQSYTYP